MIYSVTIGFLLGLPWALVGAVLLGSAAGAAKRWLQTCR